MDQGSLAEALAEFDQAILLDARYAEAYNSRGRVHFRLQRAYKAIEDYSAAILWNPSWLRLTTIEGSLTSTWARPNWRSKTLTRPSALIPNWLGPSTTGA